MCRHRAWIVSLLILVFAGCDDGKAKVKEVGQKVDQTLDKLDQSEAQAYLDDAKASLAKGLDAAASCSWVARAPADQRAAAVDELRVLCSLEVPMARATRAVIQAEAARAEQPAAPSLTECQSEPWSQAVARREADG